MIYNRGIIIVKLKIIIPISRMWACSIAMISGFYRMMSVTISMRLMMIVWFLVMYRYGIRMGWWWRWWCMGWSNRMLQYYHMLLIQE